MRCHASPPARPGRSSRSASLRAAHPTTRTRVSEITFAVALHEVLIATKPAERTCSADLPRSPQVPCIPRPFGLERPVDHRSVEDPRRRFDHGAVEFAGGSPKVVGGSRQRRAGDKPVGGRERASRCVEERSDDERLRSTRGTDLLDAKALKAEQRKTVSTAGVGTVFVAHNSETSPRAVTNHRRRIRGVNRGCRAAPPPCWRRSSGSGSRNGTSRPAGSPCTYRT